MVGINIVGDVIRSAASDLEAAADAIEAMLAVTSPMRGSAPSGVDEASMTINNHLNSAVNSHDSVANQGVDQLRQAAKTLRKHAVQYATDDDSHRGALGAILG
jgi:hypothetical protein